MLALGGTILGTTNHGNPRQSGGGARGWAYREIAGLSLLGTLLARHDRCADYDWRRWVVVHRQSTCRKGVCVWWACPRPSRNDLESSARHVWFRYGGVVRAAEWHRSCLFHAAIARAGHGGGGDGPLCRLDRAARGMSPSADAGSYFEILMPRTGRREDPRREAWGELLDRGGGGGRRTLRGQCRWCPPRLATPIRLGGIGERVAHELQGLTGKEARTVVLVVAGWHSTAFDRVALRFGAAAGAGRSGRIGCDGGARSPTNELRAVVSRRRPCGSSLDCDTMPLPPATRPSASARPARTPSRCCPR